MKIKDLFRLVFVIFSLYLMGDAFYRGDGFSYYASFHEFLPTIALAFILWSIVAVLATVLIWLFFRILNVIFRIFGLKIEFEHLLLYTGFFILFGALAWKVKKLIWPLVQTSSQVKLAVFLCVTTITIVFIWLVRDRAKRYSEIVQERITPLVWLFGMFFLVSVPIVSYHTWFKDKDKSALHENNHNLTADNTRPNIILVTFDALGARNMSAYGYYRETTPFISQWAENATVFARVEAASNFTTPAAASLMTGKRVWTHQTYHIEGTKPVRSSVESLPALLKRNGYFNIALVVNPFASVRVLGISDSFDVAPLTSEFGESMSLFGWKFGIIDKMLYRAFGDKIRLHNWIIRNDFILSRFLNLISRNVNRTEVPPEKAFNKFLKILDENIPTPFFTWIHIFPPHDPYLPPKPFIGRFSSSSELRNYKKQEQLIEESYKYLFQYQGLPQKMTSSIDLLRDYYDEYILYIDKSFEEFIRDLDKRNLKNTITILTADHGESFEHGYLTHGGPFLYEQVTHVPLIIQDVGQTKGQRIDARVEQIDIPATILDLTDVQVPLWMEGRSLVPLMHGEELYARPAFSMNFEQNRSRGHQITKGSIAVWDGDYKLIHYLKRDESLLFNLKEDPEEMDNLINEDVETSQRLLSIISHNLKRANEEIRNYSNQGGDVK